MKRYCKNCKYDGGLMNLSNAWQWCEHPSSEFASYTPAIKKIENNNTGDCEYYKRKWWKVWV